MAILYDTRLVGGEAGKSAYEYALEGGYAGTETEFAESLGDMGDIGITFTRTLTSGETTLTITDNRITVDSVLNNVYTSKFGMSVKSAVFGEGTLTLEFPSQEEDIEVKVVINAILSLGGNGLDGKDGADGKSAYEYAVEGGYTGTETEFAQLFNNMGGSNEWKLLCEKQQISTPINYPSNAKELLIMHGNGNNDIYINIPISTIDFSSVTERRFGAIFGSITVDFYVTATTIRTTSGLACEIYYR